MSFKIFDVGRLGVHGPTRGRALRFALDSTWNLGVIRGLDVSIVPDFGRSGWRRTKLTDTVPSRARRLTKPVHVGLIADALKPGVVVGATCPAPLRRHVKFLVTTYVGLEPGRTLAEWVRPTVATRLKDAGALQPQRTLDSDTISLVPRVRKAYGATVVSFLGFRALPCPERVDFFRHTLRLPERSRGATAGQSWTPRRRTLECSPWYPSRLGAALVRRTGAGLGGLP